MNASLSSTLVLPAHATTSVFSSDGRYLAVGSDDGTVRLYQPPEPKVRKAIRGLGTSVSSVLFHETKDDSVYLWVSSGRKVYRFDVQLESDKLIFSSSDASFVKEIGQDDEDVVNQLALSANHAYLACTTDGGDIYVMDLSSPSREVSKIKTSHNSIAWTASFIADRPNELLTGGYDCALLLHDFKLRTLLARFEIIPAPSIAPGISSLPPFVTALALSPHGAVAAGTADGRIWVGLGGVKSRPTTSKKKEKAKRSRKWAGLNEDEGFFVKVGESLIAGLHFISPDTLLSCTVHGKLAVHRLTTNISPSSSSSSSRQGDSSLPSGSLQTLSTFQSSCAKVDTLACATITTSGVPQTGNGHDQDQAAASRKIDLIAIAGLHADKKRGAVELWDLRTSESVSEVHENPDMLVEGEGKGQEEQTKDGSH